MTPFFLQHRAHTGPFVERKTSAAFPCTRQSRIEPVCRIRHAQVSTSGSAKVAVGLRRLDPPEGVGGLARPAGKEACKRGRVESNNLNPTVNPTRSCRVHINNAIGDWTLCIFVFLKTTTSFFRFEGHRVASSA